MTISIIQGDLLDPALNFDALAQGTNTQGIMGAGIAVAFKNAYPEMYEEYKDYCDRFGTALSGLVHTYVPEEKEIAFIPDGFGSFDMEVRYDEPVIYNMMSQTMPGRNGDYRLLQQAAIQVLFDAEERVLERIGLPWIGCGIAGLDRHNVLHILKQVWGDSKLDFIIVQQDQLHEMVAQ